MIDYTKPEILRMNACHALQAALDELRGSNTDFYLAGNHCAAAMQLIDELDRVLAFAANSQGDAA